MSKLQQFGSPRGVGMVEILVALGIMSIVMAGMSSFMNNQASQNLGLTQSLAKLDFEKMLISSFANGAVCEYILNNPVPLTFDSGAAFPHTLTPTLPIYASVTGTPAVPGPVVAQVGLPASPLTPTVEIASIQLKVTAGGGNSYVGVWTVVFEPSRLITPLRPATVSTALTVDPTNPSAVRVTACSNASTITPPGLRIAVIESTGTWTVPPGVTAAKITVVGGGGGGGGGRGGHGGGGGGTAMKYMAGLTPGATLAISIGAGGPGGVPQNSGSAGESTSIVGCCSATGGRGGQSDQGGRKMAGEGGIGTVGDFNFQGSPGTSGNSWDYVSGTGGSSFFGGGGLAGRTNQMGSGGNGFPGLKYGGGGGGGTREYRRGGAGHKGVVVIEY